ncbi:MAG: virulence RhuM family protein [Bacteroidales bacterium]|nr:virulence RhuM family protein [Bacteroidales bacterium]
MEKGEIILYQPDNSVELEVRIEAETVWLTQAQMALLFETTRNNVTLHINNIFKEGELEEFSVCKDSLLTASDGKKYRTKIYNLDVIISVGYRVKSKRGTQFRIWANKVLKEYLLHGYAINQRIERLEQRVSKAEENIDFFVRTSLPPVEGVFFNGQIFDAYAFASDLIKSAKKRIILIDNYLDESVLLILAKREPTVTAKLITHHISNQLHLDIEQHNRQYPSIEVEEKTGIHDRFLIVDDTIYHLGASLKDLGKKLFAFSKMEIPPETILNAI